MYRFILNSSVAESSIGHSYEEVQREFLDVSARFISRYISANYLDIHLDTNRGIDWWRRENSDGNFLWPISCHCCVSCDRYISRVNLYIDLELYAWFDSKDPNKAICVDFDHIEIHADNVRIAPAVTVQFANNSITKIFQSKYVGQLLDCAVNYLENHYTSGAIAYNDTQNQMFSESPKDCIISWLNDHDLDSQLSVYQVIYDAYGRDGNFASTRTMEFKSYGNWLACLWFPKKQSVSPKSLNRRFDNELYSELEYQYSAAPTVSEMFERWSDEFPGDIQSFQNVTTGEYIYKK